MKEGRKRERLRAHCMLCKAAGGPWGGPWGEAGGGRRLCRTVSVCHGAFVIRHIAPVRARKIRPATRSRQTPTALARSAVWLARPTRSTHSHVRSVRRET